MKKHTLPIKITFISLFAFIFLIILNGCKLSMGDGSNNSDVMPGINIPLKEYNTKIVFTFFPGSENSYLNSDSMDFLIRNHSKQNIVFPFDYGLKIFERRNDVWEPIVNNFSYAAEGDLYLLVPDKQYPSGLLVPLSPFIPELQKQTTIRVVVVGYLEENPKELVGAYIDVPLKPNP